MACLFIGFISSLVLDIWRPSYPAPESLDHSISIADLLSDKHQFSTVLHHLPLSLHYPKFVPGATIASEMQSLSRSTMSITELVLLSFAILHFVTGTETKFSLQPGPVESKLDQLLWERQLDEQGSTMRKSTLQVCFKGEHIRNGSLAKEMMSLSQLVMQTQSECKLIESHKVEFYISPLPIDHCQRGERRKKGDRNWKAQILINLCHGSWSHLR